MSQHGAHTLAALRLRVRHDGELSPAARLLFEDVCDLAQREDGVCVKRPESFATTYGVSVKTVERWTAELRAAGVLASVPLPSDGRRRGLQPVWPPAAADGASANPEVDTATPDDVPQKRGTKLRDNSDMSRTSAGEMSRDSVPAPRVTPPEGGENGARAYPREGDPPPAQPDASPSPTLDDVLERAAMAGVSETDATAFWRHYESQGWVTSGGAPVRKWVPKLMAWKASQSRFDRQPGGAQSTTVGPSGFDAIPDLA